MGLYRDCGRENGSHILIWYILGLYRGYILVPLHLCVSI